MVGSEPRHRPWAERPDTGSVLLFVVIVVVLGFLLFTGIVTDAARAQHANVRASDLAAKAARVGAQELDLAGLRSGTDRLDSAAARTAATAYLTARHLRGRVEVNGQQVRVTVILPVRFRILAPISPGVTISQTRAVALTSGP